MSTKKRDDEILIWAVVGGLFTSLLIGIDLFYSSLGQMDKWMVWLVAAAHGVLTGWWIVSVLKWKDPKHDWTRKAVVGLSVVLALVIGIHHAVVKEDKQVIIDSKENAAKP